jgi:hypothetical protein
MKLFYDRHNTDSWAYRGRWSSNAYYGRYIQLCYLYIRFEEVVQSIFFQQLHRQEKVQVQCKSLETIASMQTDYDSMFGDSATEERHLKALGNWRTQEMTMVCARQGHFYWWVVHKSRICLNFSDQSSEAYSTKWRRKPKIQRTNRQVASGVKHSVPSQSVLVAGGKKTQSLPVCTWLIPSRQRLYHFFPDNTWVGLCTLLSCQGSSFWEMIENDRSSKRVPIILIAMVTVIRCVM